VACGHQQLAQHPARVGAPANPPLGLASRLQVALRCNRDDTPGSNNADYSDPMLALPAGDGKDPLMRGRILAGIAFCAASLVTLGLPAASPAQARLASPAAVTPAAIRKLQIQGERRCIQPPAHLSLRTLSNGQLARYGLPGSRAASALQIS
jgi:hypothetical protein